LDHRHPLLLLLLLEQHLLLQGGGSSGGIAAAGWCQSVPLHVTIAVKWYCSRQKIPYAAGAAAALAASVC
jgi:hypothetical protein